MGYRLRQNRILLVTFAFVMTNRPFAVVIAAVMSTYVDVETSEVKQQRFSCAKNCYYCPNEPGMPRSYLSEEAAVARNARANFDATPIGAKG